MAVLKLIWENFERWVSMFFIAFMSIMLFVEVLSRYVFYTSVGWISEITGFMFVWFIYLSISYITGQNTHIRVQILDFLVPKKWLQRVDLCMNVLWLGFTGLMTYYGIQLVLSVIEFPFKSTILDISMAIPYAIIPIAFGLMTIRLLIITYRDLMDHFKRPVDNAGEAES
jgi:TRAP-type C4-dicarboxylate transport system permease small subunit